MADEWTLASETEHYFSERPRVPSQRRELHFLYKGTRLRMAVDRGVFASSSLDPGTALLIETLDPSPADRILDLGCGWGAIGIAAARAAPEGRVVLTDVNRRAAQLARTNLHNNGIENAEVRIGSGFDPVRDEAFDLIATNPPYHAGRELLLALLEETPRHLTSTGRLLLVGKGSQGIRFYQRWLTEHWSPEVEVRGRGGGYRVLEARTPRAPGPPTPPVRPERSPSPRERTTRPSSPRSS
ncbi:MAG: methyltransferase [Thermoplasmata archaeon]|nr:methyltransferase [Thermoplasmata archaeon]MCI4359966.1 methyltransferase [Thermoplasmata archaeon]